MDARHRRGKPTTRSAPIAKITAILCSAVIAVIYISTPSLATPPFTGPNQAADTSLFNPGNIIDDEIFFNAHTMGSHDVQLFLDSHVEQCESTGEPCLKNYRMTTDTREASPYCARYDGRTNESAADIIHRVGIACGINPQTILVMLQKEQGLVTTPAPTPREYQAAMGFACPDTAPCAAQYYGFFNQVYSAASRFQEYTKTSNKWGKRPEQTNNIHYSPDVSCGSTPVFIENQATANLYNYTPYQPNAAAIHDLRGSGDDCSAYGNRNFWVYFTDWFGSPTGLQSESFEDGTNAGWYASNGAINRTVVDNNPAVARLGDSFLAMTTPALGRALARDTPTSVKAGEQASVRLSLRSATSAPFAGIIAIWGLGEPTEVATQPFLVTDSWTDFNVKLHSFAAHSTIRIQIFMDTANKDLLIDAVSLTIGQESIPKNE